MQTVGLIWNQLDVTAFTAKLWSLKLIELVDLNGYLYWFIMIYTS